MPRKKVHESQAKQSARFRSEAQKLIDAGDLNPTEADAAMDRLVRRGAKAEGKE
jgi:polyhydroxyalkanoate synthesis regulator phasin